MTTTFLDTSFAIALCVRTDQHHERALELQRELKVANMRMLTTEAVLFEIANSLRKATVRRVAAELIESLATDTSVEVVRVTESLFWQAIDMFRQALDKEWSLTDCVSFVVMRDRGLDSALTADRHFKQAGFRALLTER